MKQSEILFRRVGFRNLCRTSHPYRFHKHFVEFGALFVEADEALVRLHHPRSARTLRVCPRYKPHTLPRTRQGNRLNSSFLLDKRNGVTPCNLHLHYFSHEFSGPFCTLKILCSTRFETPSTFLLPVCWLTRNPEAIT